MTLNAVGILEKEMPQVRAGEDSSKRNRKKIKHTKSGDHW